MKLHASNDGSKRHVDQSATEIIAHYDQKHPDVVLPPTGENIRDKYKDKKPEQGNLKNRRKSSMPEKSLSNLSDVNGTVTE